MSKPKVLLVDDEEELQSILARSLEEESFVVQSATDGDIAINLIRSELEHGDRYDLVLLDIKMPTVDGFEVLRFIRKNVPETKVIMITAYADVRNAIESLRLGATGFISKPYDLDDILTEMRRALGE